MSEAVHADSSKPTTIGREKHGAWWVIGTLFVLSTVLGVWAFYNMKHSVAAIDQTRKSMSKEGQSLSLEGCVDRVLAWNNLCGAIHVMCRASIHRVAAACFESKPRVQACRDLRLEQYKSSAHFQYARCEARGLHKRRHWKRECGVVYSTMWSYCQYWLGKQPTPR